MSQLSIRQRYDLFQNDAVRSIVDDFRDNPQGRFLLVVPTGGGKTFVAVRAINRLFEAGVLDEETDRIAWVAHRNELLQQAADCFDKYPEYYDGPSYKANVDFVMLSAVRTTVARGEAFRLVVIDEAHHGPAPSYQPAFRRTDLGILGLTATPSRHDGKPLDFERESFSIGFPELIEMGVVLRPEVVRVHGGTYAEVTDISDDSSLEVLNNKDRNQSIVNALLHQPDDFSKVIVYAGTKQHVQDLHAALASSALCDHYEEISYVLGDENSRNVDRQTFVEIEKSLARSILVNAQVLSEGYDDPRVNTVVMAAPTKSKLVYMQALGRAIRHDPDNSLKRAFVLEVVDGLPNIRYRIDNRWLFSDISDTLEPAVEDVSFSNEDEFQRAVARVFDDYKVPPEYRWIPPCDARKRVTMLLFKYNAEVNVFCHIPVVITNQTRPRVSNVFNFLSQRMGEFANTVHPGAAFKMLDLEGVDVLQSSAVQELVYNALENQWSVIDGSATSGVADQYPWITFVAFRLHRTEQQLSQDLLDFTRDMINRSTILELLETGSFESGFYLVKLPLPLAGSAGRIMPPHEFAQVKSIVSKLGELRERAADEDHRGELKALIDGSVFPVEIGYVSSFTTIIRDSIDYYRELTK